MSDQKPYGDVPYADPGYQPDKQKRYPLDTYDRVKAAWSYINQTGNAAKYTAEQLARIKSRIKAAAKQFGIEISDDGRSSTGRVEYADAGRMGPFPARWGNPPRDSETRAAWILAHCRVESLVAPRRDALRRLVELQGRRWGP